MKIETYEKTIGVPAYIEGYVNVEEFLECCKVCGNGSFTVVIHP